MLFVYPGVSQSHLRVVVAMLARSARVPIGFEEVAGEPQKRALNVPISVTLPSATMLDVLDVDGP